LPTYDAFQISFGNRVMFFILVIVVASYAAREMARVERELVAERARSEALLKDEVSHQVAARSRELGQILSRIESSMIVDRLKPGDRFDTRYVVSRELGAGGMGAVYEVERATDGQQLALKVITGEVSASHAARFAQEAEIGARVRHRNLVSIVDVGVAPGGTPFLVMELARGGSLENQRARFGDSAWALPIIRQIAAGLSALHDGGVVHRDLKPANVLFASDGVAKISDFGISRFGAIDSTLDVDPNAATMRPSGMAARAPGLTATGALLGTPFYMAPEAARGGRAVGTAADVFAFGIIASELIAGRPPFEIPPVFASMVNERVTEPTVDLGSIDPAARDVIRACLSIQSDRRPSMRDVCAALGVSAREGEAAA
jgi:serine/threonine protein kinase